MGFEAQMLCFLDQIIKKKTKVESIWCPSGKQWSQLRALIKKSEVQQLPGDKQLTPNEKKNHSIVGYYTNGFLKWNNLHFIVQ